MKKISIILFALVLAAVPILAHLAGAQILSNPADIALRAREVQDAAGFGETSIGVVVAGIIRAALGLLAIIFVILTILSGFRWMTAGGNEENVKSARETLKTAIIGLIIVLAAYAITYFIFKYLPFSGTGGDMTNPI